MVRRGFVFAAAIVMVLAATACGDDGDAAPVGAGTVATSAATTVPIVSSPAAVPGLEVPADYPLPVPDGGALQRVLVDDAAGTSNIAVHYAPGSLDSLVAAYDKFFAGIGDTTTAGPADGLASWSSADRGFSVVVSDVGSSVQVVLQTGV